MATKTKHETITSAIAAQQAEWHCRQAAEHFAQSSHFRQTAPMRQTARKRFLADARHALPTMGLDAFLAAFRQHLINRGWSEYFDAAQSIITALAAELALVPRTVPVAAESASVADALAKVKEGLAAALAKVDEALRAVELPAVAEGQVETRC